MTGLGVSLGVKTEKVPNLQPPSEVVQYLPGVGLDILLDYLIALQVEDGAGIEQGPYDVWFVALDCRLQGRDILHRLVLQFGSRLDKHFHNVQPIEVA